MHLQHSGVGSDIAVASGIARGIGSSSGVGSAIGSGVGSGVGSNIAALWPIISHKSGDTIQDQDASCNKCLYMSPGQMGRSDMGDPPAILSVHQTTFLNMLDSVR